MTTLLWFLLIYDPIVTALLIYYAWLYHRPTLGGTIPLRFVWDIGPDDKLSALAEEKAAVTEARIQKAWNSAGKHVPASEIHTTIRLNSQKTQDPYNPTKY